MQQDILTKKSTHTHKKQPFGTLAGLSQTWQAGLYCIQHKQQESTQHQSNSSKTTIITSLQQATSVYSYTKNSRVPRNSQIHYKNHSTIWHKP